MKFLLLFVSMTFMFASSYAGSPVNTEDYGTGIVQMEDLASAKVLAKADKQLLKEEKQQIRAEKRMAWFSTLISKKMAKSHNKALGGLNDPVDKWFWFWIIGWGAAILLTFSISTWYLSSLFWLAGTVCGIIWIVKKFA